MSGENRGVTWTERDLGSLETLRSYRLVEAKICVLEIADLGLHEPIRAKCLQRHGGTLEKRKAMSQISNDYMLENIIGQFQNLRSHGRSLQKFRKMPQLLGVSCQACLHCLLMPHGILFPHASLLSCPFPAI